MDQSKKNISRREFVKMTGSALGVITVGPALSQIAGAESSSYAGSFDFIVVGAGSGGGIMANRLVRAGFKVLLMEAGIDMPTPEDRRAEATQFTIDDRMTKNWRYVGEPEQSDYDPSLRTPLIDQTMGKMVGGSSHHYGMVCYRAAPEDFDEWDHYLRDGAGRLSGTLRFDGTTTVRGTRTRFTKEVSPGDYIRLDADGQPFRVVDVHPRYLEIDNPEGLRIPAGSGAGTKLTPWNRSSMLVHYKAVENDIDFGASDPVNHRSDGYTEIGRIGGAREPGDFGETRPNVRIPRINPILLDVMESITSSGPDGSRPFPYIDDINDWSFLAKNRDNVHKIPLGYVGRNRRGELVAGGHQTNSFAFLDKYEERRSTLIVAVDPVRGDPNLTIEAEATVNRVLFRRTGHGLEAAGVEYLMKENGAWRVKTALSNNVILAAGAYGTPAILMRSGVGARERLEPFGIRQILDLPGVGANLTQHIGATLTYEVNKDLPLMYQGLVYGGRYRTSLNRAGRGFEVGSPPRLFDAAPEIVFFISTGATELTNAKIGIFNYGLGAKRAIRDRYKRFVRVAVNNYKPRSRGQGVTLRSIDPREVPTIRQGIFQDREALDAEAILEALTVIDEAVMRGPFGSMVSVRPAIPNLAELHAVIGASYHGAGTCGMGPEGNPLSVCDERARLRGVRGIRVCDASIFPTHVRANNHLTITANANLIADMIIADGGA